RGTGAAADERRQSESFSGLLAGRTLDRLFLRAVTRHLSRAGDRRRATASDELRRAARVVARQQDDRVSNERLGVAEHNRLLLACRVQPLDGARGWRRAYADYDARWTGGRRAKLPVVQPRRVGNSLRQ